MARLRHIAIATKDPDKTAAFYQKVFGLKFVKKVPDSPRGGGVFLSDGHINFAFLNYPSDEAADMVGGASYEGLHHMGFQVDDLKEAKTRLEGTEAELLGDAVGSHHSFYFEQKVRGPHGIIMDMSTQGWDLEPPGGRPCRKEGLRVFAARAVRRRWPSGRRRRSASLPR